MVKKVSKGVYSLKLDVDFSEWSDYFAKVKTPSSVQSWIYGEAKAKSGSWVPSRAIVYKGAQPIALLQILVKKTLFIYLVRINRGPLWLYDNLTATDISAVMELVKKLRFNFFPAIFFVSPNLVADAEIKKILLKSAYFKRPGASWRTGLVNLKKPIEELYAELRPNWRGQLKSSEKKGLDFSVSQSHEDFQWLMQQYDEYKRLKKFAGPSLALLEALFQSAIASQEIFVFMVQKEGQRVAAMLAFCYAKTAETMVIWVGNSGRNLNAGNFLFWYALCYLKENGYEWLDHGGVDRGSGGRTKFKLGVPCEILELAGEYVAI